MIASSNPKERKGAEDDRPQLRALAVRPTRCVPLQVSRALAASVVAAAVDFVTLVLLVEQGGFGPELSAVFAYLVGGVANYVLCAHWVFPKAPQSAVLGFGLFTLLSLGGWASHGNVCTCCMV